MQMIVGSPFHHVYNLWIHQVVYCGKQFVSGTSSESSAIESCQKFKFRINYPQRNWKRHLPWNTITSYWCLPHLSENNALDDYSSIVGRRPQNACWWKLVSKSIQGKRNYLILHLRSRRWESWRYKQQFEIICRFGSTGGRVYNIYLFLVVREEELSAKYHLRLSASIRKPRRGKFLRRLFHRSNATRAFFVLSADRYVTCRRANPWYSYVS